MFSHKIPKSSFWAWACAALAGPVAVYSAGCGWIGCLALGLGLGAVCSLVLKFRDITDPPILLGLELIWCVLVLLWLLRGSVGIFPQSQAYPAVPLVLLALGIWSVTGGNRGARIGSVAFRFLVLLLGFVLVWALGDVRLEWTVPRLYGNWNPLATVLLLPAAGVFLPLEGKEDRPWWLLAGAVAMGVSLCTGAVLAPWVAERLEQPLWELGRSVRILGRPANLESLLCAGLTLSWFCAINFLFTVACTLGQKLWSKAESYCRWILGAVLAVGVLLPWQPMEDLLAAGAVLFWGILPVSTQLWGMAKNKSKK